MDGSEYVVWYGNNIYEVENFASATDFGFVVGSNIFKFRWYHNLYRWLVLRLPYNLYKKFPEWQPENDYTILEIYPDHALGHDGKWYWTTAKIGDKIYGNGKVE